MITALVIASAIALDLLLGEPKRFHPLVGFGYLARRVENLFHRAGRIGGVFAVITLLAPLVALTAFATHLPECGFVISAVVLYLAIGLQSLGAHASAIAVALREGDLPRARSAVGRIVSRDTEAMEEEDVARAAVESVLENGNDAVFATLFWFIALGAPGAVLYRLANTLDAMWGYRNERYLHFGWAAARFDDLLNYLPARLTALTYALFGNIRRALRCWRAQAPAWESPNAGPVMAAGAGSLGLALGGRACYEGEWHEDRPRLGEGRAPIGTDIARALWLVRGGVTLWLLLLFLIGGAIFQLHP